MGATTSRNSSVLLDASTGSAAVTCASARTALVADAGAARDIQRFTVSAGSHAATGIRLRASTAQRWATVPTGPCARRR